MIVSGILSSAAVSLGAHIFQNRMQKLKQEFQQLGKDLQAGNLSAAQADFATLQKMQQQPPTSPSAQSTSTLAQDSNQLTADLKAGNTPAAQRDWAKVQKDIQTQPPTARHHHHHHGGGTDSQTSQMFSQLGTALQSGDLSAAQQAYAAMLQNFRQYAQTHASPAGAGSTGVSLIA